jgi:hypothetical protein
MKLIGNYDNKEIDLEGDVASLRALADSIRELRGVLELNLDRPDTMTKNLYFGRANSLKIQVVLGNVRVSRDNDQIVISGSSEKLQKLAKNIESTANNSSSTHTHIEFFPGHFFLEPDSVPLIITRL